MLTYFYGLQRNIVDFATFKLLFSCQYHLAYTTEGISHKTVTTRMFEAILL